jgi:hypothetical protein
MLTSAIVLFGLGAVGGVILAYLHISKKDVPFILVVGHGILVATALVLLILTVAKVGGTMLTTALVIFLVAAIGGFILLSYHLRTRLLPVPLIYIHGLAAVAAFVILLASVLKVG